MNENLDSLEKYILEKYPDPSATLDPEDEKLITILLNHLKMTKECDRV